MSPTDRMVVKRRARQWASKANERLHDLAGPGKSAMAQMFVEIGFADGKLGVSFFCSRDFGDRSYL